MYITVHFSYSPQYIGPPPKFPSVTSTRFEMAGAKWAVSIHGGAGEFSKNFKPEKHVEVLNKILDRAVCVVKRETPGVLHEWTEGSSTVAMRAAVEAVVALEDCPFFNAGRGSVITTDYTVEMEAAVMEGSSLDSGACCGLTTVVNPIIMAELVRTRTRNTFFGFDAAEKMAKEWGLKREKEEFFIEEVRKRQMEKLKKSGATARDHDDLGKDDAKGTVGAVVRDMEGNLAVAVSTGGYSNKPPGRIGDSPCVAAGSFATKFAAVCGTGTGEHFVNNASCAQICFMMEYGGMSLKEAVRTVIHEKMAVGTGGVIAVSHDGEVVMDINTSGMFRGFEDSDGNRNVLVFDDDEGPGACR